MEETNPQDRVYMYNFGMEAFNSTIPWFLHLINHLFNNLYYFYWAHPFGIIGLNMGCFNNLVSVYYERSRNW